MFKELSNCVACGNKELFEYLNFGRVPLANAYLESYQYLKTYPLEVLWCGKCYHSQLSIVVDSNDLYKDYKYVSGTTQTLKDFFLEVIKDQRLEEVDNVLDIGSNDGTFLKLLKNRSSLVETVGVEPAENLRELSKANNIPTLVDFWNSQTAWKVSDRFDVITGFNVFAHQSNPKDFLLGCSRVLSPNGRVVIGIPYGLDTFTKEFDFGQIYHEHINYYNCSSFANLVESCGYYISKVDRYPIHNGSIVFTLKKGLESHCSKVSYLIQQEIKAGLNHYHTYKSFADKVERNIKEVAKLITNNTVIYGASAKISTLLNSKQFGNYPVPGYCVDDNPLKHNLYQGGIYAKIIPLKDLRVEDAVFLLGAPNFKEEIKNRLKQHGGFSRSKIITFNPTVGVENV